MTVAQVLQDFSVTLDQPDGRRYEVAEIQAFSLFLQRFIECVDFRNLLALFSRFLLLRRLTRSQHVVSKLGVALGANHLVLGARDRGQDIADLEGRIPQVLVVGQPEPRKPVGQQVYRLRAVIRRRVLARLPNPVVGRGLDGKILISLTNSKAHSLKPEDKAFLLRLAED